MDTKEISPALIDDFNLEPFVEGMSGIERKAYYKGFYRCYYSMIKGLTGMKDLKVFRIPSDNPKLLEEISDHMIAVIEADKKEVLS